MYLICPLSMKKYAMSQVEETAVIREMDWCLRKELVIFQMQILENKEI